MKSEELENTETVNLLSLLQLVFVLSAVLMLLCVAALLLNLFHLILIEGILGSIVKASRNVLLEWNLKTIGN
jgi:hypothetical protein